MDAAEYVQGVSRQLRPGQSANAEEHSTSDNADSSDDDSSSSSGDEGPAGADHEAGQHASGAGAHKSKSHRRRRRQVHGRGVVKMHASLHAHKGDSEKVGAVCSKNV